MRLYLLRSNPNSRGGQATDVHFVAKLFRDVNPRNFNLLLVRIGVRMQVAGDVDGALWRGIDRSILKQRAIDCWKNYGYAHRHRLNDGAAETLHPIRMGEVDPDVNLREKVSRMLISKLMHNPVLGNGAKNSLGRLRTTQNMHLNAFVGGIRSTNVIGTGRPLVP